MHEVTFTGGEIGSLDIKPGAIFCNLIEEAERLTTLYPDLLTPRVVRWFKVRTLREPTQEDRAVHAAIGKPIPDGRRMGCAQYLGDE